MAVKILQSRVEELKRLGYVVRANHYGYQVKLKGEFITGDPNLPKDSDESWLHFRKKRREYYDIGWTEAYNHWRNL